ncbi:MAG: sigma factor-like helix-turn-helix DNA-binding protein [Anaerolineales bacterium]|jgi:DNA-directed RNA polymerase specialized sigma24 family protein
MLVHTHQYLTNFNNMVLQYQQDAYTLAFYTLGNEPQACEIVQKAITYAYFRPGKNETHLRILHDVTRMCLQVQPQSIDPAVVPEIVRRLHNIPIQERQAVILIDILGLSYAQTAMVCNQSESKTSSLLARARVHMLTLQSV